jgi:Protein of unknown function (DUF2855)
MPDFLVRRDDLRTTRVEDPPDEPELHDGEARLRIERFGFTANNVTYGAFGEQMGYWRFFPAPDGWGRIPVWGFGAVADSRADGIAEGQRFYGYFPMSSTATMRPRPWGGGFEDGSVHRADLPATYNRYFEATPQAFPPEHDAVSAVVRPLYMTGWLIAQHLHEGSGTVALASASSKTAYSTAYAVGQLEDAPAVIGLTSGRNADFVRSLGFYDTVLTYDEADQLPRGESLRYVDMAGDAELRRRVHEHLADDLEASIVVGATHWDQASLDTGGDPLPGPQPEFFFAPSVLEKLSAQLGAGELQRRLGADWLTFLEPLAAIVEIEEHSGADAVERVYRSFLDGTADPRKGHVLNL